MLAADDLSANSRCTVIRDARFTSKNRNMSATVFATGNTFSMSRIIRIPGFFFLFLFVFASCKKGDKPVVEELKLGTCSAVTPKAGLTQSGVADSFVYRTSGGGIIVIKPELSVTVRHEQYPGFKIELWGMETVNGTLKLVANHENLNGKHIKDKETGRRSVILPDGAKLTIKGGSGYLDIIQSVSIIDGSTSHLFSFSCNQVVLEHSSSSPTLATALDQLEADGETSAVEFTTEGLVWVNIYTENMQGTKVNNRVMLGEIKRSLPNNVNDFYDDPRFGHT